MPKTAKTLSLKDAEALEAKTELLKLLKPGDTVYTILRHVASSGMFRVIDLAIPVIKEDRRSIYGPPAGKLKPGAEVWVTAPEGADRDESGSGFITQVEGGRYLIRWQYPNTPEQPTAWKERAALVLIETRKAPAIRSIGWLAARAMHDGFDRDRTGIKASGCGMDMGFSLVYNLGATLWPKGTPKPHGSRNGEPDRAGGYALKHTWL